MEPPRKVGLSLHERVLREAVGGNQESLTETETGVVWRRLGGAADRILLEMGCERQFGLSL